jgi:hypothetical protein
MSPIKSVTPNRVPKSGKTNPAPVESREAAESGEASFSAPAPAARGVSAQAVQRSFADASSQFATPLTYRPIDVHVALAFESARSIEILANGRHGALISYLRVIQTIDAKAGTLGYGPQDRFGDVSYARGRLSRSSLIRPRRLKIRPPRNP